MEPCPQCHMTGWHKMSCTGVDPRKIEDDGSAARRRQCLEAALLAGASWPVALEAASTVALDREGRDQTYTLDDVRASE